jgi:predicted DNA-binding helix-hairpin-helix protein
MRFYFFKADEIVNDKYPNLDLTIDPKLSYALRNLHLYPIDINKADYEMILRVPGIGVQSAKMIVMARRHSRLNSENLKKIGVVMKRAKYFITCNELMAPQKDYLAETLRFKLLNGDTKNGRKRISNQLDLFTPMPLLP